MAVPYIKTPTSITVILGATSKVIPSSHPNYERIVKLVAEKSTTKETLTPLLDIPQAIENFTNGEVKVINGKLFYKGFEVKTTLAKMILQLVAQGEEEAAGPFQNFLARAHANPDPRAAQDLFDWVSTSGLPITPDGHILAWKNVNNDYRSLHSPQDKRFDHHVGNMVEQEREACDSNPNKTCSTGLHFCAEAYLKSYSNDGRSRVVVVKIDPADVVAFPNDYHLAKGRACRYEVVDELGANEQMSTKFDATKRVTTSYAAKPTPPVKLEAVPRQIVVGEEYKDGYGNLHKVVASNGVYPYSVKTKTGLKFTATGKKTHKKVSQRDLII